MKHIDISDSYSVVRYYFLSDRCLSHCGARGQTLSEPLYKVCRNLVGWHIAITFIFIYQPIITMRNLFLGDEFSKI